MPQKSIPLLSRAIAQTSTRLISFVTEPCELYQFVYEVLQSTSFYMSLQLTVQTDETILVYKHTKKPLKQIICCTPNLPNTLKIKTTFMTSTRATF